MTATAGATDRTAYGIEALNVWCGLARITTADLFAGRGLDPARLGNLMMTERSIGLPIEDPVTNAVNAARPLVDALPPEERDRIELVVTSTESGVDYSKSLTSYVHEHLGLNRHCRLLEVKQACFGATAALQTAVGYLASGISPGAKALVIATDVAVVDEKAEYSEPAAGHGAVALLLGDDPRVLALDLGAFGNYSYETLDSARPSPRFDIADVDRSLFAYLDCLKHSYADYASRVVDVDVTTDFDHLVMHTPFAGLVKAGHRKLMREHGAAPHAIDADFTRRVAPSLAYPSVVGNLCSGSVYLALASLLDSGAVTGPRRIGLFSYGSGCSSEFFSGVADERSAAAVAAQGIKAHLDHRARITFDEYLRMLDHNLRCLEPVQHRTVDPEPWEPILARVADRKEILTFTGVKDYHRQYAWR
ncbi:MULTISPECIES: hydroxymethylglutaryl-CoA synthase family protein [unclassified Streptomyces]|uniref:hydroxymethylglutaryl-CoA synthase family protein n=1 Tax=unclassified Streptomyces TaxID=2593676 RepID=UPI000C27538F|nr:hydroxymethylglutaryl-CoA synthase [Streptomyces sp. CB02959]PJN39960.1 3-hydroxy-3-methylglutaryl-ACP synthase [Streptomyces sp. CB02959]